MTYLDLDRNDMTMGERLILSAVMDIVRLCLFLVMIAYWIGRICEWIENAVERLESE